MKEKNKKLLKLSGYFPVHNTTKWPKQRKIFQFFSLLVDEKREKACFLHGWFVLYEPLLHLCIQGEEAQTLRSPTPKRKKILVPAVFRILKQCSVS
jgi:hypothetical protein